MPVELPVKNLARLEDLVNKYGTPLQLYDETLIRSNVRHLLDTFKQAFPDFHQFYAVKALPNPAILKLLTNEGCGLDCSSTSELHIARQLGIPGDQVMYTSNYTSDKDLGIAYDQGVIINLDDITLIDKLVEIRGKCPELICFRLNPGLGKTNSETKSNVLGGPKAKFGIHPDQIVDAYRRAKANGAKKFGIHMMTGSCVLDDEYWMDTVTIILGKVKEIKKELDIDFEFVNIGGGLGIPYKMGNATVDIPSLVPKLKNKFDEILKDGDHVPKLYMENGRYLTGPFGWLVAKCNVVKDTYAKYYGLDACMSNLMRPGMYGSYHYITVPSAAARNEKEVKANVVGTLCENNDWFASDRMLPLSKPGDLFVIHDSGAHSHSMGFQYNGKLRAPEVLLQGEDRETEYLIRDREVIEQLYENTHIPPEYLKT